MRTVHRSRARAMLAPVPLLIVAGVAALTLLGDGRSEALPLLVLGPVVAAVYSGVAYTAVVGGTADALCGGVDAYRHLLVSDSQVAVLVAVVGASAAAVAVSGGRQRRARELADVAAIADIAQQALLRPVAAPPSGTSPVQAAVRYISATSGARIGGDLYEMVAARAGTRVIVGDVRGKGLPAAQTAAVVLGAFRETGPDAANLNLVAARIEHSLARHLSEEEFVTAVLAEVSRDGATLTLLNCGHPPPLLLRGASARFIEPTVASLPLGLARPGGPPRPVTCLPFQPGDQLLLYTDGVSEARDRRGEFFPLERWRPGEEDPAAALDSLTADLARHVGRALDDDAAMLLLRRRGCGPDGLTEG